MDDVLKNIYVVLHNVHSASKTMETAQVVYGLGYQNYVVSKAEGSAAQSGVPDANRLAIKMKRNFMVLPDLPVALETLDFDYVLLIPSPKLTKARLDPGNILGRLRAGEKVAIVLSGSTSSFSRRELDLGESSALQAEVDIGPSGTAAVILHTLLHTD